MTDRTPDTEQFAEGDDASTQDVAPTSGSSSVSTPAEHDDATAPLTTAASFETAETDPHGLADDDASTGSTADSKREWSPGDTIGPYTLERRLGSGGFGEVWMAHRANPRLAVAIKVLKRNRVDRDNLRRFEIEAQALAFLEHRYVAKIHDAGTEHGLPYIAMEYVEGSPLNRYCDDRRLSFDQRLELMVRVCEGVQHAHQRGLIHRDLKPDNILVTEIVRHPREIDEHERRLIVDRSDESVTIAVPKVVDFGLAKSAKDSVRLVDGSLSMDLGRLMGTPEYMAPEQADPAGQLVTQKADIFALGVVLYQLLSGTLPLSREQLRNRAVAEMVSVLRYAPRPDLSTGFRKLDETSVSKMSQRRGERSGRELANRLQSRVRHLCGKALRLDPERRFSSAAMMALDIRNYLADRDFEEAAAEPRRDRVRRNLRRHRLAYATAAGIFLALLAGIASTTWQYRHAVAERDRALAAEARTSSLVRSSRSLLGDILEVVRNEDQPLEKMPDRLRQWGADERALSDVSALEGTRALVTAEALMLLGFHDEAIEEAEIAVASLSTPKNGFTAELAQTHLYLAEAFFRGRYADDATHHAATARRLFEDLGPEHRPALLDAMEAEAGAWKWSGDHATAAARFELILRERTRLEQPDDLIAGTMYDLALTLEKIARATRTTDVDTMRTAVDLMREARELWTGSLGPDREETIGATAELARMVQRLEPAPEEETPRYDPETLYLDAIEHADRRLGPRHWRTLTTRANLAILYRRSDRLDEAAVLLEDAFDAARTHLDPGNERRVGIGYQLARVLCELDRTTDAHETSEEVLRGLQDLEAPSNRQQQVMRRCEDLLERIAIAE